MTNKKLSAVQVCEPLEQRHTLDRFRIGAPSQSNPPDKTAKNQKIDAAEVWKEIEDLAVPTLRLSAHERAAYCHLLRHSRIEGRPQLCFSIRWLARNACLSAFVARRVVRRLIAQGALDLLERSRTGHLVAVRLPEEIPAVRAAKIAGDGSALSIDLEAADFLQTRELREAIHSRERGRCFYCSRRLSPRTRCLDHIVPQVHEGGNSYRNLVSCCTECNSQKKDRAAGDFLRWLYREGRLGDADLKGRLRALELLAQGKLQPRIEGSGSSKGAPRGK
ncbi:MAG TPA: HNH endonuclease [Candidatus Acidoferrum sp.]|nr:HNH endonuclease [Candidatus Acidoferrum sp.]